MNFRGTDTCSSVFYFEIRSSCTIFSHRARAADWLDRARYFDYSGNMETTNAVRALGALAQETRLGIFRLLVTKGSVGMAAGDLSNQFEIPPATMSFHLKELSNAGLIASRRESRSIIYAANYENMQELMGFLMENCCADTGGKC